MNNERWSSFKDAAAGRAWRVFPRKDSAGALAYARFCMGLVGSSGPGRVYARVPVIRRTRYAGARDPGEGAGCVNRKHPDCLTKRGDGWVRHDMHCPVCRLEVRAMDDFLRRHADADEIVMDQETGLPVKAVYSGPDCTGNYRTRPAMFWFTSIPIALLGILKVL